MDSSRASTPRRFLSRFRPDVAIWCLWAIIAVGGAFRFAGITWGLPLTLHPDEWVVVRDAIGMARQGSFSPTIFMRPDHLEVRLSHAAYEVLSRIVYGEPPEVVYERSVTPFYAISRAITACFGTAMIPLAYLIARRLGRGAAVMAAFAVAFFPPFIEHSQYATPDIPVAFAMLVVVAAAQRYIDRPGWVPLAVACAGLGLGVTAKYPGIISAAAIAYAVILVAIRSRRPWDILIHGLGSIALFLAAVFVFSPTLLTNLGAVREQLVQQNSTGHLGSDGLGWAGNVGFYAVDFTEQAGLLLVAAFAVGTVRIIAQRRWDAIPMFTGAVFWVVISVLQLHWSRWGIPAYTTGLLVGAIGAAWAWSWARSRLGRWAVGAVVGVSGLSLLASGAAQAAWFLAPPTRQVALEYVEANGITAEDTSYDAFTPFTPWTQERITDDLEFVDGEVVPRDGSARKPFIMTSGNIAGRILSSRPDAPEADVYRAVADFPVVERWTAEVSRPASVWDPVQLVTSIGFLAYVADGGMSGTTVTLYTWPDA